MTTPMRERLARAILLVMESECDESLYACGTMSDKTIGMILDAILSELERPDEGMVIHGLAELGEAISETIAKTGAREAWEPCCQAAAVIRNGNEFSRAFTAAIKAIREG